MFQVFGSTKAAQEHYNNYNQNIFEIYSNAWAACVSLRQSIVCCIYYQNNENGLLLYYVKASHESLAIFFVEL